MENLDGGNSLIKKVYRNMFKLQSIDASNVVPPVAIDINIAMSSHLQLSTF